MSQQQMRLEPHPVLGPDDPVLDLSREEAAYERQAQRLVRDHCGQIALIVGDEVAGVFSTADEAYLEGFRRFGDVRMVLKEIREPGPPDFMPLVDITHPSFRKMEWE